VAAPMSMPGGDMGAPGDMGAAPAPAPAPTSDFDSDVDGFDATDAAAGGSADLGREKR